MAKHDKRVACAMMVAALATLAGMAQAQNMGQAPLLEPVVPRTHSVEQADAKLKEVEQARAAVGAEYAASEEVCNTRFFVNHCLDQAKEKRRAALSGLRAIEVEASRFKRQHAVEQRDRELADRLKKDEEELARRAAAPQPARAEREPAKPAAKPGPTLDQRQAAYEAKVKRQQEKDAAEAGLRAQNVAEFEKKKADSERRQAQVAEKKLAREEKARKRAAEAEAAAKASAAKAEAAAAKERGK
ncbi:hypothetical protein [Pseudoduganella namucuonensis]|uniref:Colicin import membrane protein n=1 Tax=Pseudoduganella namucuonensis TaxID=1035707 RepID=A0A1I7LBA8_9BURK|nr:hypothetical protein [Pseudoduganella namucuonensis]SFV06991.1 hypothetical protein SAMN05216552_102621 [Pseudoduganella namucuonensis]